MDLIEKYAETLYNKIRNRFSQIAMIDGKNNNTNSEKEARVFNFAFLKGNDDTMVTLSLLEPERLKIYFDRNMVQNFSEYDKNQWYDLLEELRRYTVTRPLKYDVRDLDKPGLSRRDIQSMIQSSKEKVDESRFSRLHGSRRTSYQMLERHKIKVLHGKIINDDIHGSRSRNIKALFIENNLGERIKFPFVNLSGVRAMARHLEEGGHWGDQMGNHILEITNNLCTIKNFVREVKRHKLVGESMLPVLQQLREKQLEYKRNLYLLSGSKGYHSYQQNLTETYIEPVESLAGHFSNINPSIEKYLPSIEKILGEKQIEGLTDVLVAECVDWINGRSVLTEAAMQVTPILLRELGIIDPEREVAKIHYEELEKYKSLAAMNKLRPVVKGTEKGFSIDVENRKKLVWLLANNADSRPIQVTVQAPRAVDMQKLLDRRSGALAAGQPSVDGDSEYGMLNTTLPTEPEQEQEPRPPADVLGNFGRGFASGYRAVARPGEIAQHPIDYIKYKLKSLKYR